MAGSRGRATDLFARISVACVILPTILCLACSPAAWQALGQGLAPVPPAPDGYNTHKLMIFGGLGHKTYLGCLSCNEYATDSVFNKYGTHGSEYSNESIFNSYSEYGSAYSNYSACNAYATDPPVIVDEEGSFYGRLTTNHYHSQATKEENLLTWLENVVCN